MLLINILTYIAVTNRRSELIYKSIQLHTKVSWEQATLLSQFSLMKKSRSVTLFSWDVSRKNIIQGSCFKSAINWLRNYETKISD